MADIEMPDASTNNAAQGKVSKTAKSGSTETVDGKKKFEVKKVRRDMFPI
jgi:hypothetical protein